MDLKSLIKTKEERLEDQKKYSEKLFPFGETHKSRIETMVQHLSGKSQSDPMLFFYYIVAKEKHMGNAEDHSMKDTLKTLKKIKPRLNTEQLRLICALIILDTKMTSIDALPSQNEIQSLSQILVIE